jgi:hypothetical protein
MKPSQVPIAPSKWALLEPTVPVKEQAPLSHVVDACLSDHGPIAVQHAHDPVNVLYPRITALRELGPELGESFPHTLRVAPHVASGAERPDRQK